MKHANWLVVVTLVVLSGMAAAQMHSNTTIIAQVPFDFMVANKVVPAGQYTVQAFAVDTNILVIRNPGSTVGLFSRVSLTESKQGATHYALLFNHYGNRYFLAGVEIEGSKTAYRVTKSKAEAELEAQNVSATNEIVLAYLK
ncbi:MAG TPA: hypothetical protein VK828_00745 [Terriglobales bacterium]|jgi:hypothetical protein|nr:hypothetical protein [Terriglobales bacterium]